MKLGFSNSRSKRLTHAMSRAFASHWSALGLLALATLGIRSSQANLSEQHSSLAREADVYALPDEEQLLVFCLGYRAAAADLLFGRTMVAAGIHFTERRVFEHLDAYLNGILALDPNYLDVYRYADALLNLSTVEMPPENLRIARDILERGLKQFPHDADLWTTTGQFIAYLAPQRLPASEDVNEWRRAGARVLQHACEISPSESGLPRTCVSSASLLTKSGETVAAMRALERLIAIADEPQVRAEAMERLKHLAGQRAARKTNENLRKLEELRQKDLPAVSRLRYQLLAPPNDARACLRAEGRVESVECATSFARRSEIESLSRIDD